MSDEAPTFITDSRVDGLDSSVTSVAFHDDFARTPNTVASAIAAPSPKRHIEDRNGSANNKDGNLLAHPL
jgi:hypothetical protein